MKFSRTVPILIAAFFMLALLAPMCADDSDAAASDDIRISIGTPNIGIGADTSRSFVITVYNLGTTDNYDVRLSSQMNCDDLSITYDKSQFIINHGAFVTVTATIHSTIFITAGTYNLTVYAEAFSTGSSVTVSDTATITASSIYDTEGSYNKIMGFIELPWGSPLNYPIVTASITGIIWFLIAFLGSILLTIIARILLIGWKIDDKKEQKIVDELKSIRKYIFGVMLIHGTSNVLKVYGAKESIIVTFDSFSNVMLIVCFMVIAWKIFKAKVSDVATRLEREDKIDTSLAPLILMIGKITVIFATAIATLAVYGVNLVTLIMSMGLVTTGISLGAKNVINQFLCGIILLWERPFIKGDKIKVGGSKDVMIVQKVGFMTTRCKNWANEEFSIIPNSTLMDSQIVNITRDNINYKVYDYYGISHSADVTRAKEIMKECAYENPEVIAEGAFGAPEVRFEAINNSAVILRLSFTVVDHENYGSVGGKIREEIYKRFNEEGIEIPYTQYTVDLIKEEPKVKDPDTQ